MNNEDIKVEKPALPQQDLSELDKLVPDKINNEDIIINL